MAVATRGRKMAPWVIGAVVVAVVLHLAAPSFAGAGKTLKVLKKAEPGWIAVGLALSGVSLSCYAALFRTVMRTTDEPVRGRLGWGPSAQVALAGQAASTLVTAGGAGGIALMFWALTRAGLARREAIARIAAFLMLLYGVYMGALFVGGLGLSIGVLPGPDPDALTLVPAGVAVVAFGLVGLAVVAPAKIEARLEHTALTKPRLAKWASRAATVPEVVGDGARTALAVMRSEEWRAPVFAVGYWGTNVAVLWACFHAFGQSPQLAPLVQAFFVGMIANLLPLLPGGVGSVEAGMIGALLAFGQPGAATVVAVLAYRLLAYSTPPSRRASPSCSCAARWPAGKRPRAGHFVAPVAVQLCVGAAQLQQLLVGALLGDLTAAEHDDPAGALDGGEAVGDHDRGPARPAAGVARARCGPRCARPRWRWPRPGSGCAGRPLRRGRRPPAGAGRRRGARRARPPRCRSRPAGAR